MSITQGAELTLYNYSKNMNNTSLKDGIAFQHVLNSHDPEKQRERKKKS